MTTIFNLNLRTAAVIVTKQYNKKIKSPAGAGWDANTQGRFAIMPYVSAQFLKKFPTSASGTELP